MTQSHFSLLAMLYSTRVKFHVLGNIVLKILIKKLTIGRTVFVFINVALLAVSCALFLSSAKKNQSWPFNSGLGKYLPNFVKYYGNRATEDESIKHILTTYHKIKSDVYAIPSTNAVGKGGGVVTVNDTSVLTTLNNGELFIFNMMEGTFSQVNTELKDTYVSVRDIEFDAKENSLLVVGVVQDQSACKALTLDRYEISIGTNSLEIGDSKKLWLSEFFCDTFSGDNSILGSRVIVHKDYYLVSVGMFAPGDGINEYPQSRDSVRGKIVKISDNGDAELFSIGHRNPQGLFVSKKRNAIISTEHGPRGGDEVNVLVENNNYGWPCKTWGVIYTYLANYNPSEMWPGDLSEFGCIDGDSYQDPIYTWTPSIAASQGIEYQGEHFENFRGDFIVGSLKAMSLFRMDVSDTLSVVNMEEIEIGERIRDLTETNDGKIVLYTDVGNLMVLSNSVTAE